MDRIILTTRDHPEANNRTPLAGEVGYQFHFPLDDGRYLTVRFGAIGFENISQVVMDMLTGAPSSDDGSVPPEILGS